MNVYFFNTDFQIEALLLLPCFGVKTATNSVRNLILS